VRARINRPDSIDVAFANGGLTGTGAHPGPLHRTLAARGVFSGLSAQAMEGRAYFTVDTVAQLDAKWPSILAGRPDFIKTYLNGDHRLEHPGHGHASEAGLTPAVLRAVVERAHRAGLRVSTHVDTAGDFGVAVRAGVDEVNHLPLANPKVPGSLSATAIDWADAAAAGRRGMVVVLTANVIPRFHGARWDAADHARVAANQRANIRRLRAAGVPLAIGSDGISGERPFVTALDEVRYLSERGLVSNLELLQMWTQATAATIFPTRRIGRLDEGYEADFLVLAGDPTEDAAHLQRIVRRVKAGRTLLLPQGR
jgi:imidazolonepropionase-like amidohydrolase